VTAAEARRNRRTRYRMAELARASDPMVKAWLGGLPAAHAVFEQSLRDAAVELGIDLATLPRLTDEQIALARKERRPKCRRCRELAADLARETALLESTCDQAQALRLELAKRTDGRDAMVEIERLRARVAELEDLLADKAPTPAPVPLVRRQDQPVVRIVMPPDDQATG
jgi:hypothetical protein